MTNLIKSIRIASGLNQEQFAKELGTTVLSINRWENNKTSPNKMAQKQIYKFYKEHNLDLSNILFENDNKKLDDNSIILYHGSRSGIKGKIEPISRDKCDFGKGFYLGTEKLQPLTLICNEDNPIIYKVKLKFNNLKIYSIDVSLEWAILIAYYRGYLDDFKESLIYKKYSTICNDYDVIVGPIADDRMYRVMTNFFNKEITDIQLLNSLSALKLGIQYVCKTEKACENLEIIEEKHLNELELAILKDKSIKRRDEGIRLTENILEKYRRKGKYFDEILKGGKTNG